jgi:hypothetical protein
MDIVNEIRVEAAAVDSCPSAVSFVNHLVAGMRAIETEYAPTVMMTVRKLAEELSLQLTGDSEKDSETAARERMASARKAFEERVLAHYADWDRQQQSLSSGVENLGSESLGGLNREIAETELAIENGEAHVQWMLRDASVELARIMRARLYQSELKAYLRGLRFQAEARNLDALELLTRP